MRTKRSGCSASAYTSRLRTSYSSSTRWNRTSRAFLLRRSGERRPRMPKPSKRDQLVEATKELLWESGLRGHVARDIQARSAAKPGSLAGTGIGRSVAGTFCRADRASQCLFMNENRKTFSRFEISHLDPKGSSARNLEPWYAPHLWARVERRAHRQSRGLIGQDLDATPSQ